jgi:HlyD family secretion protein
VKQADLPITIMATGAVAAKNATPVIPEISGRVASVCANGVIVKTGDEILRLDPTKLQEQLADLTTRYKDAQIRQGQSEAVSTSRMTEMRLRLQQAEDGVAAYERQQQIGVRQDAGKLAFDTQELEKSREDVEVQRRLAAKGLVPETDVERQDAGLKAKEYALKKASSDLDLKKTQVDAETGQRRQNVNNTNRDMSRARGWTERDVRMSGNEVDNLKLQLARAQEDLGRTVLKASVGGLVMLSSLGGWIGDSHPPQLGDYVSQGREVAQIIDVNHMQVKIELDQSQITGVRMGQVAEVAIEALPGRILKGKISSIGQNARRPPVQGWFGVSSSATFPVTIDLPPTGTALIRPGMRANVRLVAEIVKQALLVPLSCVFRYDGKSVVYVDRGGGAFGRVTVTLGRDDGDYVAITKGLKAGQRIALNDLSATSGASSGGTASGSESPPEQSKEPRSR